MESYKIPSASETRGVNMISSLLLVQSTMTFLFIFICSVGFFLVKGFFFTRRKNRTNDDQSEANKECTKKKDLILDGLRNPSQFVFESFGYNKYMTIALYIFRLTVCCWIIGTIISYPFMRNYGTDNILLKSSTYFTHHMVMVFTTYFSSQTLFGLCYLVLFRNFSINFSSISTTVLKRRNKWLAVMLRAISGIIWIVGELNLVASLVVSIGYWIARLGEQEDGLDYISVAYHGVTGLLSLIDFLLSNFQFRKWHVFTIMCFPSLYFVWMLTSMRNRLVSEFPYSVMNFYLKPWYAVILVLFGIYLVLGLSFMSVCLVSYLRNKILVNYLVSKEKSIQTSPHSDLAEQPDNSSGSDLTVKDENIIVHTPNYSCDISISVSMYEMTEISNLNTDNPKTEILSQ